MAKRKLKKSFKLKLEKLTLVLLILLFVASLGFVIWYYMLSSQTLTKIEQKKEYYTLSDFGLTKEISKKDYNNNGKDDYADILEGAKKYAEFNPKYKSEYYDTGYPPVEKEGVSADLIWYALKNAGYSLRDMIDQDIINTWGEGIYYIDTRDYNIDFRRVSNQERFLIRYAKSLTTDIYDTKSFMPGDIITFDYSNHIAIVSDKYNINGVPYIIHNYDSKQKQKEENVLETIDMKVTGHYRFEYNEKIEKLISSRGKNE